MSFIIGLLTTSCSKNYLSLEPQSTLNSEQLSRSSTATLGILKGVYSSLRSYPLSGYAGHEDFGHKAILSFIDLMGNDVIMYSLNWGGFNYNYTARIMTNSRTHMPWLAYYTQIKNVNTIISTISIDTDDADLKAILGQAYALRGYFHFMLARIYGPTYIGNEDRLSVPINAAERSTKRNTTQEVYTQIVSDLNESLLLLTGYSRGANRELLDISVAETFLADVYLEMGKYSEAATLARSARTSYSLLSANDWRNGFFDINQNETMWGADINAELTTFVASFFSHFDNSNADGYSSGGNINIDRRLYEAMTDIDIRKEMFAGADSVEFTAGSNRYKYRPYTSFKFRDLTSDRTQGDYIYLRSSLLYFIEAEALARINRENEAKDVLFEITRARDISYVRSINSGSDLIDEIILQKRIELWGEGFAWFDLKRLKKEVVRDYVGTNHPTYGRFNIPADDNRFIFMIPQAEVDANPEILPNNPQ
ncbi:RagB/SusD family nutrient uptake outer membrane protein [Sphingobacterium rhinopitheci]|uniref:RagB/SusD family nutrient uptake outer membrane protein n=1 Tax=Sphingobacterium rhinopitheci TaxID=2781960 RepID=UPI001F51A877|nr:RagB/SusD family nutrient uptake outer membrane protein [Sphingobacterium rhinopitheci]